MKNKYIRGLALGMAAMTAFTFTTPQASLLSVEAATATKATKGTSKITASKKTVKVAKGNTATVKLTLNKKQAKDLKITVKSKSNKIAKVTNAKKVIVKKGKKVASVKIKGVKANSSTKVVASFKTSAGKTKKVTITVKVNPIALTKVTLNNKTPKVGDTLTATITPSNASAVTYKWYMGDSASKVTTVISGQTKKTLTVTDEMAGKFIKVVATGKTAAGKAASKSATTTAAVEGTTPDTPVDTKVEVTGVKLDNTSPKVGDTLTATPEPASANNIASYKWEAVDGPTSETGVALGTTSTCIVSGNEVGKFIRVTVTDTDGKTFTAVTTSAVIEDNTASVTIRDKDGLQSDGTGLVGDTLRLTYGSGLGVPQIITWYYNDTVVKTSTDKVQQIDNGVLELNTGTDPKVTKDGAYRVVIVNSKNETFTSNTINLVYDELPAQISSMTIADDYASDNGIDFDADDEKAVVTVTMKKMYAGKFYIYEDNVVNYSDQNYKNLMQTKGQYNITANNNPDERDFVEVSTFDKLTPQNVRNAQFVGTNGTNTDNALKYIAADGTTTLMYEVKADAVTNDNKKDFKRGKSYKLAFDQTNIKDDDIKTASRKDVNATASVVAPYVTVPSKIVLQTAANGQEAVAKLLNEEGAVLSWLGMGQAETALGFESISIFGNDKTSETDKVRDVNGGTIKKGEFTSTDTLSKDKTIYWAEAKTVAGVYGEAATTLKSEYKTKNIQLAKYLKLAEDSDTATSAKVTLKDVAGPAQVYVYDETKNNTAPVVTFDPADSSTYITKAAVTVGQGEVIIPAVFTKDDIGHTFKAVLVPDDESAYARLTSTTDTDNDNIKNYTNNQMQEYKLLHVPTSADYKTNAEVVEDGVTTVDENLNVVFTDKFTIKGLIIKDQFGQEIPKNGNLDKQENKAATIAAINEGGSYTEKAGATYSVTTNDTVVIKLESNSAVDKKDGFKISALGTTLELKANNTINNNTVAGSKMFTVKLGSDTLIPGYSGTTITTASNLVTSLDTAGKNNTADVFTYIGNDKITANINVASEDTLIINQSAALDIDGKTVTVDGKLENNGTIKDTAGNGTITGKGTVVNKGNISAGTINMTVNNTYEAAAGSKTTANTITGYVKINGTNAGITVTKFTPDKLTVAKGATVIITVGGSTIEIKNENNDDFVADVNGTTVIPVSGTATVNGKTESVLQKGTKTGFTRFTNAYATANSKGIFYVAKSGENTASGSNITTGANITADEFKADLGDEIWVNLGSGFEKLTTIIASLLG